MNYEYLPSVFIMASFIYFVVQIIILLVDKQGKYSYVIKSIGLGIMIFNIIIYTCFLDKVVENALGFFVRLILTAGIEFIILLISFIFYKVKKNREKNIKCFITYLSIILVINFIVLFAMPLIVEKCKYNNRVDIIKEYLVNAHGDIKFNVIDWGYETEDDGIISSYVTGYWFKVTCEKFDDYFIVVMDNEKFTIETDYFLDLYYSMELGLDYEIWINLRDESDADFNEYNDYLAKKIEDKYFYIIPSYEIGIILRDSNYGMLNSDNKINTIDEIVEFIYDSIDSNIYK